MIPANFRLPGALLWYIMNNVLRDLEDLYKHMKTQTRILFTIFKRSVVCNASIHIFRFQHAKRAEILRFINATTTVTSCGGR